MSERIYKGTAEVRGIIKPVTYKIVNAPESRDNDLRFIQQTHDGHKNIQLTQVYDSDKPAVYATPEDIARKPEIPPEFMTPLSPAGAAQNPTNAPPREASIPPANAPTGSMAPQPMPVTTVPALQEPADEREREPG